MVSFLVFSFNFMIFITSFTPIHGAFSEHSTASLYTNRIQKITHLHFYFHVTLSGKNPTAMRIISPPNKSAGFFGSTFMMDDPLTEGQEPTSKLVGRAQGMYAWASQHDSGLLMILNFAFTQGIYNGSTVSILGRNTIMNKIKEMPIVGGSGIFRYARGYSLAKTVWFSGKTGDAVVEYNVYVLHY